MAESITSHDKSGYLHQPFLLFHLKDQVERTFDYHYHDFYKIVLFVSGQVTYHVEGKSYLLKPGDILLIHRFDIHKPEIDAGFPYERFILWVNEEVASYTAAAPCNLFSCFQKAREGRYHLIRLEEHSRQKIFSLVQNLEASLHSDEFGCELLTQSLFLQLMIGLNRIFLGKQYIQDKHSYSYDKGIDELMQYINQNLTADLSVEALARHCYLSKYHLMRKFKEQTGCTLHQYVQNKRLLYARTLIQQGTPVVKASGLCGFHDYTAFSRAYKKLFRCTPTQSPPPAREAPQPE